MHVYFKPGFLEAFAYEEHGASLGELQDRSHVRDVPMTRALQALLRQSWRDSDALLVDGLAINLAEITLAAFSAINVAPQERRVALARRRLKAVLEIDLVYADAAKDAIDLIAALTAKASGREANNRAVLAEAFARMGEVLVFRVTAHAAARRFGVPKLGPAELHEIKRGLDWL